MKKIADYGIDAYPSVRNMAISGALVIAAGYIVPSALAGSSGSSLWGKISWMMYGFGSIYISMALLMLLYSKSGKLAHRDRMIAMIKWTGSERVLDVGCGRGLLLNAAARKLTTGKATGIDIWAKDELTGNKMENALLNAQIEGVSNKIEILNADVREIPFTDGYFDVVLSNQCLHNIKDEQGRNKACCEMSRVLKTGGTLLLSDYKYMNDFENYLKREKLATGISIPYLLDTFPALKILKATK